MDCARLLRRCHSLSMPLTDALAGIPDAGAADEPSPWRRHSGFAGGDAGHGLYCLARVDESTGAPLRLATDKEAEELGRLLELSGNSHLLTCEAPGGCRLSGARGGSLCGRGSCGWRGGGPCDHCGAT
ncbi:unnamed protein product, partial [Ostreobium quekettii]